MQLIDTKDASNFSLGLAIDAQVQPADSATSETQEKNCFIYRYQGVVKRRHPEKLRLEIVNADTHFAGDTTEITVTVQIKNDGRWPVLLPWETNPVVPEGTGGPNDELRYEVGSLWLRLGTQEDRAQGAILEGGVEMEAVPHSNEQHVRLLQGQWVEVQFKALARCWMNLDGAPLCSEFKADEHARLIAEYNEWLYTRQGEGCKTVTSSAKARKVKSDPIEIDFVPADVLGPSNHPSSPPDDGVH